VLLRGGPGPYAAKPETASAPAPSSTKRISALNGRAATSGGKLHAMPVDLLDLELETTARACRALAYEEREAAKRMENPGM
jgi:hypothetical protein